MRLITFTTAVVALSFTITGCASSPNQQTHSQTIEQRMDRIAVSTLPESERAKHTGFGGAMRSAGYFIGGVFAAPFLFALDPTDKNLSH